MTKLLIAALAAFLVVGCTTPAPRAKDAAFTEETLNKDGTRVTVTKTSEVVHNEIVKELVSRPLVKITCPPSGCVLASFEVGQPLQGQVKDLIYQPREAPPELHPVAQFTRELMQPTKEILLAIGPAGIVAGAMGRAFNTFGGTVSSMAREIQAPAGTSVAISGSNGVGVLRGQGTFATADRHDTVSNQVTTTSDNRVALDILCNFYMQSGTGTQSQAPAYCQQK